MNGNEKQFSENDSGLNRELEMVVVQGRENIKTTFEILTERLEAISILLPVFDKSTEVLEIWTEEIDSSLKELKEDIEFFCPELLFEVQIFEMRLAELKVIFKSH